MKTQEEYAREIDEIVLRDVESCQSDWFKIDKEIFMLPENKNKIFILGTRKTGCSRVRSPDSFTEQNVFDFTHLTFSRWNLISKTSFTQPSCPKQGTE